jgi:hypothetical protein
MSNRNNDVFQVLVTKGNLALLAAGSGPEALAVGQLGLFDANTHLSVTATVPREYYFALGIDPAGGTTMSDIRTSAGQLIQSKNIFNKSFKGHTAGQPKIVKVQGYTAECDKDYGIRVEYRNAKIYRIQGFNQFSQAFVVRTPCCDDCAEGCDSLDSNILTQLLVAEVNRSSQGRLVAQAVARQAIVAATVGTSVDYALGAAISDADIQVLIDWNADDTNTTKYYTDFTLTSVPIKITDKNVVSLGYYTFLQTDIIVSRIEGFGCAGGSSVITQELAQEEGSGLSIQHKEYHASGWNGSGPYVLSEITGTAKYIPTLAVPTGTYDQFILEYNQKSESGWLEYENPLSTIFAVPEADTVTRNSLATVLDVLTAPGGFEALADDAAAASTNPAVVEPVVTDVTKDGIA